MLWLFSSAVSLVRALSMVMLRREMLTRPKVVGWASPESGSVALRGSSSQPEAVDGPKLTSDAGTGTAFCGSEVQFERLPTRAGWRRNPDRKWLREPQYWNVEEV